MRPFVHSCVWPFVHTCARQTMTSVGTPIYVAPEVMKGYAYDAKCDSYSFGICLVAMIRGEKDIMEFYFQALRKHMKRNSMKGVGITTLNTGMYSRGWRPLLPLSFKKAYPRLDSLIRQCWANVAEERPTFDDIVRLLGEIGQEVRRKEEPEVTFLSQVPDSQYHTQMVLEADGGISDMSADSDLTTTNFVPRAELERMLEEHERQIKERDAVIDELRAAAAR